MRTQRVAIIGGGLIGLTTAWRLRQDGHDVTVFDGGTLGRSASLAAAGMLAPQLEVSAPSPMLSLCLDARRHYGDFASALRNETGLDVGFRERGALSVALDEAQERALEEKVAWQQKAGLRVERLTRGQWSQKAPGLEPELRAAAFFPDEAQVDNRALVPAVLEACHRRGVTLVDQPVTEILWRGAGQRAEGIATRAGKTPADLVVLAAGAWSTLVPDALPTGAVSPVRGQMLQYRLSEAVPLPIVSTHGGYLVTRDDGRVIVGSTMERAGFEATTTAEGMEALEHLAGVLVPALRGREPIERWAGLRPGTDDTLPLLGFGRPENLIFATGHFRNGILLADLTARLVADLVRGNPAPDWLSAFSPQRLQKPLGIS